MSEGWMVNLNPDVNYQMVNKMQTFMAIIKTDLLFALFLIKFNIFALKLIKDAQILFILQKHELAREITYKISYSKVNISQNIETQNISSRWYFLILFLTFWETEVIYFHISGKIQIKILKLISFLRLSCAYIYIYIRIRSPRRGGSNTNIYYKYVRT